MSEIPFSDELEPAGLGDTIEQYEKLEQIKDKPNKIIRTDTFEELDKRYKGKKHPEEVVVLGKQLFAELENKYHISVPVQFIIGKNVDGEKVVYTITDRIEGSDLNSLDPQQSQELHEKIDNLYTTVALYFTDKLLNGEYYLVDIFKPSQYVYGGVPGSDRKQIYLVDTDLYIHKTKIGLYSNIAEAARHLKSLEDLSEKKFTNTRQAIQKFLDIELQFDPEDIYSPKKISEYKSRIEEYLIN